MPMELIAVFVNNSGHYEEYPVFKSHKILLFVICEDSSYAQKKPYIIVSFNLKMLNKTSYYNKCKRLINY